PVDEIQLGIVRAGQPHRAATALPAVTEPRVVAILTRPGYGIKPPQLFARGSVVRIQESARAEFAAGDPDEHLVFHVQRRAGDAVTKHRVGDLRFPERQTGSRVQRDERRVERADEQPLSKHSDAAVEWIDLVRVLDLLLPRVSPDLTPGPRVEGDDDAWLR